MNARERIAAAVEEVRARRSNIAKTCERFGMTTDVLTKACRAAGVEDFGGPPTLASRPRSPGSLGHHKLKAIPGLGDASTMRERVFEKMRATGSPMTARALALSLNTDVTSVELALRYLERAESVVRRENDAAQGRAKESRFVWDIRARDGARVAPPDVSRKMRGSTSRGSDGWWEKQALRREW